MTERKTYLATARAQLRSSHGRLWSAEFARTLFTALHGLPYENQVRLGIASISRYRDTFRLRHPHNLSVFRLLNIYSSTETRASVLERLNHPRSAISLQQFDGEKGTAAACEAMSALVVWGHDEPSLRAAMTLEVLRNGVWQRMQNVWEADDPVACALNATLVRAMHERYEIEDPERVAESHATIATLNELLANGRDMDFNAAVRAVHRREWSANLKELASVARKSPNVDAELAATEFDQWNRNCPSWATMARGESRVADS